MMTSVEAKSAAPPGDGWSASDTTRSVRGRRVVVGDHVWDDAMITVRGGRIEAITAGEASAAGEIDDVPGWIVPGFVDTHCHGGDGADYATLDPAEAVRARGFHLRAGTTTTLASLVTAEVGALCAQLAVLAPLVRRGDLAGIHLEGPFLSSARRGAHDVALLLDPTSELVERLLVAGDGAVTMVTLAPERPGALAAIRRLAEAGVVAAVGHTDADAAVVRQALDAGATVATHLFNAMPPIHHRDPGPVPLLLTDPRCWVELIADGVHLHPDVVRMALEAAGPDRTVLVTDATPAAGAGDGDYRLGARAVRVAQGQARLLEPNGRPGALAGSTLTMADAFAFVVGLGVGIPGAARMAATTPALAHGLVEVGRIEVGCRADLCVVDDDGRLLRVMRAGAWVEGS
jgi:N-acetylglucosamine-6-phosphate deacetylase